MLKFEQYNIILHNLPTGKTVKELMLDDVFFKKIDSPEVQKGNVKAIVSIQKRNEVFELSFDLNGTILIQCDRCLDDMEQPISHKEILLVKFGDKFSEENEIVIVPESEGSINIAWFLYEFIILNIPIKHTHPSGECNKDMMGKLKKHIARSKGADDEENGLEELDEEEFADSNDWDGTNDISE